MSCADNEVPRTVFTHFYDHIWNRDHTCWPITGLEETGDVGNRTIPLNVYLWKQELEYAARAKMDVLALMFWAPNGVEDDGGRKPWRTFVDVARERQDAGFYVPKVCCHYDGMGFGDLKGLDLGSDEGIDRIFAHLAEWYDFWTHPDRCDLLFTFRGADVCFMYRPEALGGCACPPGARFCDELRKRFARRYPSRRLYLVLDTLWTWKYDTNDLHADDADNYYFWGASHLGPSVPGGEKFPPQIRREFLIRAIGPGFYDKGHNQSNTPNSEIGTRKRDWRGGQTCREDWQVAINGRHEAPWLLLETWNLFLERSEITVNNKFGDLFINICAEMVPKFKAD